MSGEPRIVVVPDPDAASAAGARHIAESLAAAVSARGRAHWATTGGSTSIGVFRELVTEPLRDSVPWSQVQVWWGDDRFVPRDHPLSNVGAFDDILVDIADREEGVGGPHGPWVPIQVDNIHPFRCGEAIAAGRPASWVAQELVTELRASGIEVLDGWPVFDLIQVGIGPDGHVLSVFADSPSFDSSEWAMDIPAPTHVEPHVARVTMNPAVLGIARDVLAVATGAAKATILRDVLGPERNVRRWPGQAARRAGATWILDEAAAAQLPGG